MRTATYARNVNVVAAVELNAVAVVRGAVHAHSRSHARLLIGPSAGKTKPGKRSATFSTEPAAPSDFDFMRAERTYRSVAACQHGRLGHLWQRSALLSAAFDLSLAG